MARRLRIQYPGAIYHVINRGNYRRDVFGSVGAAQAFEATLDETCAQFGWRVHGYAVMRNHFHLALETPEPNLVEGMHWLQGTFATRFNRFREERGHLFQGRYQSLLVEDSAALVRVVDYIHLNPVRSGIVAPVSAHHFRWGSLGRFRQPERPAWLACGWLSQLAFTDDRPGWDAYGARLIDLASMGNPDTDERELCRGWAIGTRGWRAALAKEHEQLSVGAGIAAHELLELKHERWKTVLERVLKEAAIDGDWQTSRKGAAWKCALAERLRLEAGASHKWIAETLEMGSPNSVRSWLSRRRSKQNQQISA